MDGNILFFIMADIRASKAVAVGAKNLFIDSRSRQPDCIIIKGLRSKIKDTDKVVVSVFSVADKGDNGIVSIFKVKPLKAGIVKVNLPE